MFRPVWGWMSSLRLKHREDFRFPPLLFLGKSSNGCPTMPE